MTVEGGAALNRVTWTQSGLHVAAGDDQGKVWVYDVGEQLAVPQPDEWNKFAHTLQVITIRGNLISRGSCIIRDLVQHLSYVILPSFCIGFARCHIIDGIDLIFRICGNITLTFVSRIMILTVGLVGLRSSNQCNLLFREKERRVIL